MFKQRITSTPSKGRAGSISLVVTILGAVEMAYPGRVPGVSEVIRALPLIGDTLPLVITLAGALYAAVSSAVPQLRALVPWKKIRR